MGTATIITLNVLAVFLLAAIIGGHLWAIATYRSHAPAGRQTEAVGVEPPALEPALA